MEQKNDSVTQGSVTVEPDVLEPDNTCTTNQELYTLEQDSITGSDEPDENILESDAQLSNISLYPVTSSRESQSGSDSTIDRTSRHICKIIGKVWPL